MARPLRLEYPGAIYHVTARGNARRAIFRSDPDRFRFLDKLSALRELHRVEVYAFALMTNHYHLVVCTPRGNLTTFMHQFQTSYTVYFNRRHGRTGHLFGGRYKSPLVEGGHYLLRLTRYVHLNPIKTREAAGLELEDVRDRLREYRWSSFPGYAGLGPAEDWVTYRALDAFSDLGPDADARRAYLGFVEEGLEEDDEAFLETLSRSSKACGSVAFLREAENRFRETVPAVDRFVDVSMRRREAALPPEEATATVLAAYGITEADLVRRGNREAKDFWMRLLHEECGLTQREIGRRIGHTDGSTVGPRLARVSKDLDRTPEAAQRYRRLREQMPNPKA